MLYMIRFSNETFIEVLIWTSYRKLTADHCT